MATEQRVFLDTNIILDAIDSSRKDSPHARQLFWYASDMGTSVSLIASITSFKDAYYVLCKLYRDEARARESIAWVMENAITPVDMRGAYGKKALQSDEPDFEDGLIRACVEAEAANCIITRDAEAFRGSRIPSMTAEAYLKLHNLYYEEIEF